MVTLKTATGALALTVTLAVIGTAATLYSSKTRAQTCQPPAQLCVISPVDGSVFAPGDTFPVTVVTAPGVAFENGVGVTGHSSPGLLYVPPYQFQVQVPASSRVGKGSIAAIGSSAPGEVVYSPSVTIFIEHPGDPVQLRVVPSQNEFSSPGEQVHLAELGTFSDGKTFDLTLSSLTTFTSSDPDVASVDRTGIVTSIGPGNATIKVQYRDREVDVPVSVPKAMPGDLNGDGLVDKQDLNLILDVLNEPANQPYDNRDMNKDGMITVLDARKLMLLCTNPRCAAQ